MRAANPNACSSACSTLACARSNATIAGPEQARRCGERHKKGILQQTQKILIAKVTRLEHTTPVEAVMSLARPHLSESAQAE